VPTILKDTRDVEVADFKGIDAVLHLAALSTIRSATSSRASPTTATIEPARMVELEGTRRPVCFRVLLQQLWDAGEGMIDETGALNPVKRPPKEPDRVYPLAKNQEYACVYDWEHRPG
jgi:hypothetical protein